MKIELNAHEQAKVDVLTELQLKKHDRIDGRTSARGVQWLHQFTYKGQVEGLLQVAIKVIRGHQILEGHIGDGCESMRFDPEHSQMSSSTNVGQGILLPGARLFNTCSWLHGATTA